MPGENAIGLNEISAVWRFPEAGTTPTFRALFSWDKLSPRRSELTPIFTLAVIRVLAQFLWDSRPMSSIIKMKVMAGALAAGGIFWGVICLILIYEADYHAKVALLFAPGYCITAGYIFRCFARHPSLFACRAVWFFSLLVQGAWLLWFILGALLLHTFNVSSNSWVVGLAQGLDSSPLTRFIYVSWWLVAVAISIVAFRAETALNH